MYAAAYANWFVHVTCRLVVRNRGRRVRRNRLRAGRRRWGSRSLRASSLLANKSLVQMLNFQNERSAAVFVSKSKLCFALCVLKRLPIARVRLPVKDCMKSAVNKPVAAELSNYKSVSGLAVYKLESFAARNWGWLCKLHNVVFLFV